MGTVDLTDFECLGCGRCCALSGFVRVTAKDVKNIARHLDLLVEEVRARFVTTIGPDDPEEILHDQPNSDRCIFLTDDNGCRINSVKPTQCRTFPYEWTRKGANRYCAGLRALSRRKG